MKVTRVARVPPPTVPMTVTVKEAILEMRRDRGCAVAVVDGSRLAGTVSMQEVLMRVVAKGRDPAATPVGEVMTSSPEAVTVDTDTEEALKLMVSLNQCHLPVVNQKGEIKGWLVLCQLVENQVEDLSHQLDSVHSYIAADGPGG